MRAHSRWWILALMLLASTPGVIAQEPEQPGVEDPDADRIGWVVVEASAWVSEATEASVDVAQQWYSSATTPNQIRTLSLDPEGHESGRYLVGYSLTRNLGEFTLTWWTHETSQNLSAYSPGVFQYGETLTYPLFAGIFNDGMADGFAAHSRVATREMRIDYSRIAFESPRTTLRWILGFRELNHDRQVQAEYYASFPAYGDEPVPYLLPVVEGLVPLPDSASSASEFSGQGPEIGFRFDFPLHRRVLLEAGIVGAVLRGDLDTSYESSTSTYALTNGTFLAPPFPEIQTSAGQVTQPVVPIRLESSEEATAQVFDAHVSLRWKAWRELEAFVGLRTVRYDGVAEETRPKASTISPGGTYNYVDIVRVEKSATYDGITVGLTYRF